MKRRHAYFSTFGILLLSLVICVSFGYATTETTIEKILADKDSYNGREVTVSGTVSKLNFKTSKRGNEYTTFTVVRDSKDFIKVFIWGHSKIEGGQKVQVTGTYRKVKRVGRYNFYNEIEATEIKWGRKVEGER